MSELRTDLEKYLAVRRALGFRLDKVASVLRDFVSFLERQGASFITTEAALYWARLPQGVQPATWAWRLGVVRRFAAHRSATDPRTEIPPQDLLPGCYRRKQPYIYSDAEIRALIEAARELPSPRGLRSWTYSTFLGLLVVSGLRASEALALDREDVDLAHRVLTVRLTKFGKSRLVPIHPSTEDALRQYAQHRDRILPRPKTPGFFISELGRRLTGCSARWTFAKVSRQVGLRPPSRGYGHGHGPRLHDFRHRFAVQTLVRWYRTDVDVERHIHELATYLGHVHVSDTYWYLSATPELLHLATLRLEQAPGGPKP